jgi:hypothetical protein
MCLRRHDRSARSLSRARRHQTASRHLKQQQWMEVQQSASPAASWTCEKVRVKVNDSERSLPWNSMLVSASASSLFCALCLACLSIRVCACAQNAFGIYPSGKWYVLARRPMSSIGSFEKSALTRAARFACRIIAHRNLCRLAVKEGIPIFWPRAAVALCTAPHWASTFTTPPRSLWSASCPVTSVASLDYLGVLLFAVLDLALRRVSTLCATQWCRHRVWSLLRASCRSKWLRAPYRFVSCSHDNTAVLWDAVSGAPVKTQALEFAPLAVDWQLSSSVVAIATDEKLSETKHRCMFLHIALIV